MNKLCCLILLITFITSRLFAQTNTFPSNGNTGIGTTSPQSILDVITPANGFASFGGTFTPGYFSGIHFGYRENNTSYRKSALVFERTDNHNQGGNASGKIHFLLRNDGGYSASSLDDAVMTINSDPNGNKGSARLGIGTKNPLAPLHTYGGAAMTAGWSKSAVYEAVYPVQVFNSNNTRWAGIGYDFGYGLRFWVNGTSDDLPASSNSPLRITNGGNVGLGVDPVVGLDVNNHVGIRSGYGLYFGHSGNSIGNWTTRQYSNGSRHILNARSFLFNDEGYGTSWQVIIDEQGNLGIGTIAPTEKLSVNGNIRAKKLIVTQQNWSDYVFYKGYKLRTLKEVEKYIQQHQHLPEMPSAKEVQAKGISVGDTQALLLKKIEELTLYIITQNKTIDKLTQRVAHLEKKGYEKNSLY